MPYKRNLDIENGRLLAANSLHQDLMQNLNSAGVFCNCCTGFWRFRRSISVARKQSIASGKYKWFMKRRPKLWRKLYNAAAEKYLRDGQDEPEWWKQIVKRYTP